MSTTAPSRLGRRLTVIASTAVLAVTAVLAGGVPAAEAGGSGATATVTPTTTTVATATSATFKVSNTKTTITKITIAAPKGLPVTLGAIQSGWTGALSPANCGTTATSYCTATYTATATKYGVGNGANGNVSFTLNFTSPSSATTLAFCIKGRAGSDDSYLNKTLTISVTGAVVPSTLTLSGLTAPNSSPNYIAGTPVTGTVTLKDTNGNPIAITDTAKLGFTKTTGAGAFAPTFALIAGGTASISFPYTKADTLTFAVTYNTGSTTLSTTPATALTYVAGAPAVLTLTNLTAPNSSPNYIAGTTVSGTVTLYDGIGTQPGNQIKITDKTKLGISQPGSGTGTISPNFGAINLDGSVPFSFVYNGTGPVLFSVTYNTGSGIISTTPQTSLNYVAGAPKVLTITGLTAPNSNPNYVAGTPVQGIVTLSDGIPSAPGNKIEITDKTKLGFTQPGNSGVIDLTFGTPVNGSVPFSYTYNGTGAVIFTITYDTGSSTVSSDQTSLNYVAGAPAVLTLTDLTGPNNVADYTAGTQVHGTVTLYDGIGGGNGNPIKITDPNKLGITQPASGTAVITPHFGAPNPDGTVPFSFAYNGTGPVVFTVTYNAGGSIGTLSATQQSLNYVAGAPAVLTVTGLTSPDAGSNYVAGDTITGTVSLYDGIGAGNGNPIAIADKTKLSTTQPASGTGVISPVFGDPNVDGTVPFSFTYSGTGPVLFTVVYTDGATTVPSSQQSLTFVLGPITTITDVTVTGLPVTAPTIYSGDPITVTYVAKNKNGIQIDLAGSLVTVTSSGAGAFVPGSGPTNEIDGYYNKAETAVLTVHFGAVSGNSSAVTFTKKIAIDDGTFVPGVPAAVKTGNTQSGLNTCADTTACGWADLPNGANGAVKATITGTTLDISSVGGDPTQTFKDPATGDPLYTNAAPLPVTFVCGQLVCPTSTMPQNNGTPPSGAFATVGSTCSVGSGNFYPYGSYTGSVFNYGAAGKYCLFDAPSERVDFAQAFGFSYQLAGDPGLSPLTSSCTVATTNGLGQTVALPIGALTPGFDYPNATTIPDVDADGNALHACMNVRSIKPVITGANTLGAQYYVNFTALFSDDITLRLK